MPLKLSKFFLFFTVCFCGQLAAQETTNIICKAQEHWTFAEEVGHPQDWSFSVQFAESYGQLSFLKVAGVECQNLYDAWSTDERVGFVCESNVASQWQQKFSFFISRLNADFLILKEYPFRAHLDGPTIGVCSRGEKHF